MFWTILILAACLPCVRPHPTSCAEDSQCSSGFFCQTRVCIECLRCEELKREPRLPHDACVKSVTECGVCLKGLVQVYEGALYGQCVPANVENSGGILPPYGWAAIVVSLVLMVIILCLFAKLKTFKVAFAARTSVQSLRTVPMAESPCAPPPPYHDLHNSASQSEALEMQKLVENPHPCESPPPEIRPHENSSSQNARVFNNPVYVRSPQTGTRYSSPDSTVAVVEDARGDNFATATSTSGLGSLTTAEPTWTIADNNVNTISSECGKVAAKMSSSAKKTRAEHEFQDTNNNLFASHEAAPSQRSSGGAGAACCNGVMAGPSFIINVVENINNATMTHEYHT